MPIRQSNFLGNLPISAFVISEEVMNKKWYPLQQNEMQNIHMSMYDRVLDFFLIQNPSDCNSVQFTSNINVLLVL